MRRGGETEREREARRIWNSAEEMRLIGNTLITNVIKASYMSEIFHEVERREMAKRRHYLSIV